MIPSRNKSKNKFMQLRFNIVQINLFFFGDVWWMLLEKAKLFKSFVFRFMFFLFRKVLSKVLILTSFHNMFDTDLCKGDQQITSYQFVFQFSIRSLSEHFLFSTGYDTSWNDCCFRQYLDMMLYNKRATYFHRTKEEL